MALHVSPVVSLALYNDNTNNYGTHRHRAVHGHAHSHRIACKFHCDVFWFQKTTLALVLNRALQIMIDIGAGNHATEIHCILVAYFVFMILNAPPLTKLQGNSWQPDRKGARLASSG